MKILIDMNLSPRWEEVFRQKGWEVCHWSSVGAPDTPDWKIMAWARSHGYIVFTHDLDFSALLAATQAEGPSVIQVRAQNIRPQILGHVVTQAVEQFRVELMQGALISIDPPRRGYAFCHLVMPTLRLPFKGFRQFLQDWSSKLTS